MLESQSILSKPELVWPAGAQLGEGPVWVDHDSALYWVDIKGYAIHRLSWPSAACQTWSTNYQFGTIHPTLDGRFIGACDNGIHLVSLPPLSDTAETELIIDPEATLPNNRFNDGKIGPDGAFWAGTMDDLEVDASGSLYRLSPEGVCDVVDTGYIVTNGPAFSPDGRTLYHTDTFACVIHAFDLGPSGAARNKRPFIEIPDGDGYPDGMCVDNEGCLWVGHWGGWRITRFSPKGQMMCYLDMPVANVTSCVFGGADLKTLFITSAATGLGEAELLDQPDAGGLFAVNLDVAGPPTRYFDWRG